MRQNEGFDVIVIGGGPGGYTAAAKASALGGKAAVVERRALGGTCLNLGCIPTKTLLKSTEVLEGVKKAGDFGVDIGEVKVSADKMLSRKQAVIKRLNTGVEFLMKSNNITVFRGEGKVSGTDEVTVTTPSEEIVLKTRNIIIATGSRPAVIPGLEPDGDWLMNSDQALMLARVPERLLIIGGGAIGIEFASIYRKLGAQVTLVEAMDRILPFSDREVSDALKQLMAREKIVVLTESKVAGIQKSAEGLLVNLETPTGLKEIRTDKVLVAVGRCPEYEGLGLPEIGVKVEKGKIAVNAKMETNIPGIYAIGDVTGGILLAHVAAAEGTVAAVNAMGGQKQMNYKVIPSCIYTSPELASVGLSEEQAVSRGLKIVIGKSQFTGSGKALAMGENKGLVKIVAEAVSGRILGVHILGPQAASLISEAALAINLGAGVKDIAETIHAHPSLPETLLEAAEEAVKLINRGKE